jgi:hypothetical protein
MGSWRLVELHARAQALVEDGHREGSELLELVNEVHRLRSKEWTPERLLDALDCMAALYIAEPGRLVQGRTLGRTSVLELIEWAGERARRAKEGS